MSTATTFPPDVRAFVATASWRFAKTYAATWPHEYITRTDENRVALLRLAQHILEHGTEGRFYEHVRLYHHEDGKVYWSMARRERNAFDAATSFFSLAAREPAVETSMNCGWSRCVAPYVRALEERHKVATLVGEQALDRRLLDLRQ
jgi:hypothetical protein